MHRAGVVLICLIVAGAAGSAQPPRGIIEGGRQYPLDVIQRECVEFSNVKVGTGPLDARECAVDDFGEIGTVDGTTYYYARYCVVRSDADPGGCGDKSLTAWLSSHRGLAIFARAGTGARLVFEYVDREIGNNSFPHPPAFVPNAAGTLFDIPIAISGTGAGNESQYYVRSAGRWERLDADTWLADLGKRIPKGLEIWKGVWPDLKTMRARAGLYREGDANCCPTGGAAEIRLGIRGRQFVIESMTITK
jgi:hypothetical protein